MHQDFARWYSAVQMGDNKARREARWNGVLEIIKKAERTDVEALIRLAFVTKQTPSSDAVQKFRQAFRDADETLEMQGNDRELQVLAGACLALLMEEGEDIGAQAALAVTTTNLAGARTADLPADLGVLAEDAISQIAETDRNRPNLWTESSGSKPSVNVGKAVKTIEGGSDWENIIKAISLIGDAANEAFSMMSQQYAKTTQSLDTYLRIQDEELQMLWWLTGQRSWDYDRAFDAVPTDARPLVFAKELSDSTQFLPGPPSIKALLSRAGLKERKKITIAAAVNAADPAWLKEVIDSMTPSPVSTPIHFAIQRQLETDGDDAWVANWAAVTGVKAEFALPALTLSTLFYRERLLLRWE
uniref:GTPase-associated system helical domain-containing protein n=1 Tax=Candidatus Kentrum sp. DK TaxID=2126562 RepID=A0A450SBE8_9GAMM|nr:MAG: hypothetical protein BECKDK2373C_GA0170839_102627 [Candidatus Kentron sp. DK]